MIGGTKRDNLLLCSTCRIEFSLRETAARRRSDGRLFFPSRPGLFYTPFSWQLYSRLINRFTGENRVRISRFAEAIYDLESPAEFASVMDELTQPEGNGRTMIESLSQEFDQNKQFGAQTVSYFKNPDNDTEFQFFGGFLALTISAYTGMRVDECITYSGDAFTRLPRVRKDRQWIHTGLELLRRDCATVRTTGSTPSSGIADQVRPCPAG